MVRCEDKADVLSGLICVEIIYRLCVKKNERTSWVFRNADEGLDSIAWGVRIAIFAESEE